jgi:hypothetical protein
VTGNQAEHRATIEWLRELHRDAAGEDRRRAALLLGLAIAELARRLPVSDPHWAELAAEGLARLDEAADASRAAADARELLSGYPRDMVRLVSTLLPSWSPLREAFQSLTTVVQAVELGDVSPELEATLASAIRQFESVDPNGGAVQVLRTIAMIVRIRRCQLSEQEGGQPNWPLPPEIDSLIADLELSDNLAGLAGPFQTASKLIHIYLSVLIMLRILVDIKHSGVHRDQAWRDDTLRLLDQADSHLSQTPSEYVARMSEMHAQLADMRSALSSMSLPDESATSAALAEVVAEAEYVLKMLVAVGTESPASTAVSLLAEQSPGQIPAEYAPSSDDQLFARLLADATSAPDTSRDYATNPTSLPVTIYVSADGIHQQVQDAVDALLATAGLQIEDRDEPILGSWFRRMTATLKQWALSPAGQEAMQTAAHAADSRLVLAQDAQITATLLQNLPPLLMSLQATKDAVVRVGALLVVKVDWTVQVFQLTAAQQLQLDHHPQWARSPQEIIAALNLTPDDQSAGARPPDDGAARWSLPG